MSKMPSVVKPPSSHVVLVVEDEDLIRELIIEYLTEVGFSVYQASNADEACELLERNGAVELVVTDINMPGRMDGQELAARLSATHPSIPVILMSGRVTITHVDGPQRRFIGKPYDLADLERHVRELLGERAGEAS